MWRCAIGTAAMANNWWPGIALSSLKTSLPSQNVLIWKSAYTIHSRTNGKNWKKILWNPV